MSGVEARVAVFVDCDNATPEILEYALKVIAQFGRVVVQTFPSWPNRAERS